MTDQPYYTPPGQTPNGNDIATQANELADKLRQLANEAANSAGEGGMNLVHAAGSGGHDGFFMTGLTVFILACFVGYYVVWKVTPALHSPLMGITNAISSVIIVGAVIAAGPDQAGFAGFLGFIAIILASINIFGGFIVTKRMLDMFQKKKG